MDKKAEKALRGFMNALMKGDIEKMWKYSQITWKHNHMKADLKLHKQIIVSSWKIAEAEKVAPASYKVTIEAQQPGKKNLVGIMIICEIAPWKASPNGTWGVNPISVLKDVTLSELTKDRQKVRA